MGKDIDKTGKGRRQRVRESVRAIEDMTKMSDTDLLELLLFYSIPRRDTREFARELMREFGSLRNVLNADADALTSIDGIGESSALLIRLAGALAAHCRESKNVKTIECLEDAKKLLAPHFDLKSTEKFVAVCMDNSGRVRKTCIVSDGFESGTGVDNRKLVRELINCGATAAIIAHNHPSGIAAPSREDVELTLFIGGLLKHIGIILRDHLIFADKDVFSFAENKETSKYLIN